MERDVSAASGNEAPSFLELADNAAASGELDNKADGI